MNETQNGRPPTTQTRKHSGESRLGGVPKHWETRRLKGVCLFEYGDSLAEDYRTNTGFPVYGSNGLIGHTLAPNTERECLIIGRKGSSGKVLYSEEPAFAIDTTFFVDRRHTGANIRWLYYLLTSLNLESLSGDVGVPGLSRARAYQQACSYPPLEEQAAIVRFLDHADAQIQRYIAAKERLIALLEEERQALIHQAVTRGLDPNVRLKPSGVEWLGEVPEHWSIRTLGQIADSFRTGPFGSMLHQSDYIEGGIPVINPIHIRGGVIVEDPSCSVSDPVAVRLSDYRLAKHDLVFSRRGELGRCSLVRDRETNWLCGTGSIRVRITYDGINPEFVIQALQVQWVGEYLSHVSVGATMNNLNTGILKSIPILMPPLQEQGNILGRITRQTSAIDVAMTSTRQMIGLLQEYRTRLIADVVTGQLDVREAAAQLPDDFSEEEPKDEYGLITDNMDHDSYDASQPPEEEPVTERETIL